MVNNQSRNQLLIWFIRFQNRNPGYSDFANTGATPAFNFSNNNASPVSHGANALKLENEINTETINESNAQDNINQVNNDYHEELLKNQEVENIIENSFDEEEISFAHEAMAETSVNDENKDNNDLKEFGVNSEAPDLFNSDTETSGSNELLSTEDEEQEDDLEIPAFFKKTKN